MAGYVAQLAVRLRRKFACSGLHPGDVLPSVRAIEDEFHVSRTVVTEALDQLESEGILVRHHGRGTYLVQVPSLVAAGVNLALVITVDLDPQDSYLERLLTGLATAANMQQCSLAVRSTGGDGVRVAALVAGSGASGLILIGEVTSAVLAAAMATSLPCVVAAGVSGPSCAVGASWIGHDDREGAYQATQHLLALGWRRIAWLGGDPGMPYNHERLAGHAEALADGGLQLDPALVLHAPRPDPSIPTPQLDPLKLHALLTSAASSPLAFALSGDFLAPQVYAAIDAAGLRVGKDCAVIGFDDLASVADLQPSLTTVRAEVELLGSESLRLLLQRMAGEPMQTSLIPRRLIRRASTGPVAAAQR